MVWSTMRQTHNSICEGDTALVEREGGETSKARQAYKLEGFDMLRLSPAAVSWNEQEFCGEGCGDRADGLFAQSTAARETLQTLGT